MYHTLDLGTPNKCWTVESANSILIIHQVGIAHIRVCIGEISFFELEAETSCDPGSLGTK